MNLLALATLVGILLPPAIAIVQQKRWNTTVKTIVTLILVLAIALAVFYTNGYWHGWTRQSLDLFVPIVSGLILGTWGSYAHLWQNLGITQWIENVTSFTTRAKTAIDQLTPTQRVELELAAAELLKGNHLRSIAPAAPGAATGTTPAPV